MTECKQETYNLQKQIEDLQIKLDVLYKIVDNMSNKMQKVKQEL